MLRGEGLCVSLVVFLEPGIGRDLECSRVDCNQHTLDIPLLSIGPTVAVLDLV